MAIGARGKWRGNSRGRSRGLIAVIAVLALAGAVVAVRGGRLTPGGPGAQSAGQDVAATMSGAMGEVVALGARATRPVDQFATTARDSIKAAEMMRQLQTENTQLRMQLLEMSSRVERLARYEALLGLPPELMVGGVTARLIGDSAGPFSAARIANAGKKQGVTPGFAAINEYGLVGWVSSVGAGSSRVLLLTDPNTRIPVMGETSRVRAILVGDRSANPEMLYMSDAIRLQPGERIMTSGDGGLFPRGILVGYALREKLGLLASSKKDDPAGAQRAAPVRWRVRPAADLRAADFVRLLPETVSLTMEASADTALGVAAARNRVLAKTSGTSTLVPTNSPAGAPVRPRPAAPPAAAAPTPPAAAPAPTSAAEAVE